MGHELKREKAKRKGRGGSVNNVCHEEEGQRPGEKERRSACGNRAATLPVKCGRPGGGMKQRGKKRKGGRRKELTTKKSEGQSGDSVLEF